MQPRSGCRISIGSSIVTMCCRRVRLMWSIIDASVVVLPEPVAPVTSTRPRRSSARRVTPSGKAEREEVRDLARDHAECERRRAALPESVDAEAWQGRIGVRDVEVARVLERVAAPRRDHRDGIEHRVEIQLRERRRRLHLLEVAVEPHDRRLAELEVDVAGATFDGGAEEGDEVDHVQRTSAGGPLSFTPGFGAAVDRGADSCRQTRRATRATRRNGGRARPRASFGCPTSPRSRPLTTPNTPGERAAQKHTAGWRSSARLADHDAPA